MTTFLSSIGSKANPFRRLSSGARSRSAFMMLSLGLVLCSCDRSAKSDGDHSESRTQSHIESRSEAVIDLEGYLVGPGWFVDLVDNDRKWAKHLVDRAISAYTHNGVQSELRYLYSIMEALKVVQIEGSFEDYRQPLFLKDDYMTELAQQLEQVGLDTMPARHTPWQYKDGFVDGLIRILEHSENAGIAGET